MKFIASQQSERIPQSGLAKQSRARQALSGIAPFAPIDGLRKFSRNSDLVCKVNGVEILISYSGVVAYRLANGSQVAIPRDFYSKTTQRSIDLFCRDGPTLEVEPETFRNVLAKRLSTN